MAMITYNFTFQQTANIVSIKVAIKNSKKIKREEVLRLPYKIAQFWDLSSKEKLYKLCEMPSMTNSQSFVLSCKFGKC